jgi:cytochrome c peroxidase
LLGRSGLASTIAQFKTPVLRGLEEAAPYFHNGSAVVFNDVIEHYLAISALARTGQMRRAPPHREVINL